MHMATMEFIDVLLYQNLFSPKGAEKTKMQLEFISSRNKDDTSDSWDKLNQVWHLKDTTKRTFIDFLNPNA